METKQITFYNPETDIAVEDARPAKNESSSSLKTKENVASLLKKRLTKGEEEARAKRHKERLEMDEEMLELLSRVISFID
ncbi:hypothetical protein JTB14_002739 [Gonioctena quinquepunctata]|nr:hypothetical protein JTB14_002739 [Gonioctena quinquepunctata]